MQFDAFISYRRESGFLMAQVLYSRLEKKGIYCYLDLEETRSGKFNEALISAIEHSPNFILVLPKNALDRCRDEDDWVRQEIQAAVRFGKNIIPVMYDGFTWPSPWPEEIPEDIRSIALCQGAKGSQDYLSAMVDKIARLMKGVTPKCTDAVPLSTDKFFRHYLDNYPGKIAGADLAFHAGSEWLRASNKVVLLQDFINSGIPVRVVLNSSAADLVCAHMRQSLKRYVSLAESSRDWAALAKDFPGQIQVRIVDTPMLHRSYIIRGSDTNFGAANLKYYTYGNYIPDNDFRLAFSAPSPQYALYAKEFDYLWSIGRAPEDK